MKCVLMGRSDSSGIEFPEFLFRRAVLDLGAKAELWINMHTTRLSLIQQLGAGQADAWHELDQVYRPLITHWLRRYRFPLEDVQDVTQEVMAVVVRQIGQFEHSGQVGAFRNWLRTTTVNLARNYLRKRNNAVSGSAGLMQMLDQLEDPRSSTAQEFDREHDLHVVRRLLEQISVQFTPQTLAVFRMHVIGGVSAQDAAKQLGVSVASVHAAKSRVLSRLRQQAADWIDEIYLR